MRELEFEKLLRKDIYQVFLFDCPATMPFSFARHSWFVINRKGDVSRWEIFWRPEVWEARWGHLHKDFYKPVQGIDMFFFSGKILWPRSRLLGHIEGDEGSVAHKMLEFIESSPEQYPYKDTYSLRGPNSNTYPQWVLNHFPQTSLRLAWNSLGSIKAHALRAN